MKFTFIFGFLCFCVVFSFCGKFFYLADILSSFYLQYLIGALVFAAYYKLRKLKKHFRVSLFLVLIIAAKLFMTYSYIGNVSEVSRQQLKILQFNVLYANDSLDKAANWSAVQNADILVFQEVTPRVVQAFASLKEKYPNFIASPQNDAFGSLIMTRLKITKSERKQLPGTFMNYTEIAMQLQNGQELKLYELHAMPPVGSTRHVERNQELAAISKIISADPSVNKILLGDFNITPYSVYFDNLEKDSGLINSMRAFNQLGGTWPSSLPLPFRIPIDHLLSSENLHATSREVGPYLGSDHLPVITNLLIYK